MNRSGLTRLSATVLFGMLALGLVIALAYSLLLYQTHSRYAHEELRHIAEAVMRPIATLATKGVDGGNVMKLRNRDALELYESSGLLYLHIRGTSKGSPKTAFAEALPPQPVDYEFVAQGRDGAELRAFANRGDNQLIDERNWTFLVKQSLPEVANGGEMLAVFPADSLHGLVGRTLRSVAWVTLSILVVTLVIAILIGRWISGPILAVSSRITAISDSLDLQQRVEVQVRNEVGDMASAFNGLLDKVQEILRQVDDATGRLTEQAGRMAVMSDNANHRVRDQSEQTEQVAVAINQVAMVVENVASNAQQAADAAARADREAEEGSRVVNETLRVISRLADSVEQTVETVGRLGRDSENIGGVLDVIRGIAEQTNLLALNAAIEAARAGDQGRGFAVVADEVRTLASRTQASTEEIQDMIRKLQAGVDAVTHAMEQGREHARASVTQADSAGGTLTSITEAVATITDMNTQIAVSVQQQARAAEEINRNVVHINDLTGQTLEDIGMASTSTAELSDMAGRLKGLLGQFRL
jgi:methyl-accepting chemotaxis protein